MFDLNPENYVIDNWAIGGLLLVGVLWFYLHKEIK